MQVGTTPFAVALADLDGDGALDAAVLDSAPQLCILRGHNDGTLTAGVCVPVSDPATTLGVAALGTPGRINVLVAGNALTVYTTAPDLTPAQPTSYALTGTATALQTASVLPCDGSTDPCHCRPDVLISDGTSGQVTIFFANSSCDGTLSGPQRFAVGSEPVAVQWADLDGDGAGELATANQGSPPLTILGPRGVATFTGCSDGRTQPALLHPSALAALDLDHDGGRVLVVADRGDASLRLLRPSSAGPLTLDCGDAIGTRLPVAADPLALLIADLDGDGNQDLVVAHGSPPGLSVLLGSIGTLGEPRFFPVGVALRSMAVGDLDHDGRPDVVVASSGDATIRVLRSAYR